MWLRRVIFSEISLAVHGPEGGLWKLMFICDHCKLGPHGDIVGNITSAAWWFQLYMEAWTMRSIYTVIRLPFWLWESSRTGRIWILCWRNFGPAIWVSPTSHQSWTHSECPVRDTPFSGSRRTIQVRWRNDLEEGILKRISLPNLDTVWLLHVSAPHPQVYEKYYWLFYHHIPTTLKWHTWEHRCKTCLGCWKSCVTSQFTSKCVLG